MLWKEGGRQKHLPVCQAIDSFVLKIATGQK